MEEKYTSEPSMITDADPEKKTWTGYAAVFGNKDLDEDVTMPGAFKKSLQENGPTGTNTILVLNQHMPWQVLCKPTVLQEDAKGLYYEAKLGADTSFGTDAVKLIAAGLVEENSYGFQTVKSAIQQPTDNYEDWYRELYEVNLYEISPVTWGANPQARMQGMKKRDKDYLKRREAKLLKALREPNMRDETYEALEIEIKQINTEYFLLGKEISLAKKSAAMTCPNCKAAFSTDPDGDGDNDSNALTDTDGDIVECPECKCMFTKGTNLITSRKSLMDGFNFKQISNLAYSGFKF